MLVLLQAGFSLMLNAYLHVFVVSFVCLRVCAGEGRYQCFSERSWRLWCWLSGVPQGVFGVAASSHTKAAEPVEQLQQHHLLRQLSGSHEVGLQMPFGLRTMAFCCCCFGGTLSPLG